MPSQCYFLTLVTFMVWDVMILSLCKHLTKLRLSHHFKFNSCFSEGWYPFLIPGTDNIGKVYSSHDCLLVSY